MRMILIRALIFALIVLPVAMHATTANAQAATIVRTAFKEMFKLAEKNLGREAAREITEKLGQEGAERILGKAMQEGGEEAVERVVKIGASHGARALRVLEKSPAKLAAMLDELPAKQLKPALNALERYPALSDLALKFGREAVQAELAHPGVGAKMVQTFGVEGLELSSKIPTSGVIQVVKHQSELLELSPAIRSEFFTQLKDSPPRVIAILEKSPNLLKALTILGIGVPVGVNITEGTIETTNPDGTKTTTAGPLAKGVDNITSSSEMGIAVILAGFAFAIAILVVAYALAKRVLNFGKSNAEKNTEAGKKTKSAE